MLKKVCRAITLCRLQDYLEANYCFNIDSVEFSAGKWTAVKSFSVVRLSNVFQFSKNVICKEPATTDVVSSNIDVTVGLLAINIVVTGSDINIFAGTKSVKNFGCKLLKAS